VRSGAGRLDDVQREEAAIARGAQASGAYLRGGQGAIGAVTAIGEHSLFVAAQGGQIEITKLRYDGGKKLPAPQVCAEAGLSLGAILGG